MYTLTRILNNETGCYGVLSSDTLPLCVTLERQWLDNQPDISAIPEGVYQVEQFESPSKGQVWQVMDVPNRSSILIHAGNTEADSLGCVIVATYFYGNTPGVGQSQIALSNLRNWLPDSFEITIKSAYP